MSNLGQMVARIAGRLRVPTTGASGDQLRLAIQAAIRELRLREWAWNVADFEVTLVAGQASYVPGVGATDLPVDFLRVVGDDLTVLRDGNVNAPLTIARLIDPAFELERRAWGDHALAPHSWRSNAAGVELVPAPDAAHTLVGRYLQDLGNLTSTYDAETGVWSFSDDDYPASPVLNAWFDDSALHNAADVLRLRAEEIYARNYLKGEAAQLAVANVARERSMSEEGAVQHERRRRVPDRAQPYYGSWLSG